MAAWRVTHHGQPADVLEFTRSELPEPSERQVLVEVRACGVNFADSLLCRGDYQESPELPFTPGLEVAGVVLAAGDSAGIPPGTRVVASPALPHGGYAQRCLAEAADVLELPEGIDDVTAAASHIAFQTAWIGLHRRARLRSGETVLVHAAAGGTGSAALQLAREAGARVLAVAGGAAKAERCRQLGAHEVIDRHSADIVEAVRDLTAGRGVDIVYDPVGGPALSDSRRSVAFEGRVVVVGFASGSAPDIPANHVLVKNYDVIGLQWPAYRRAEPELVREAHREIGRLLAGGRVRPLLAPTRPLTDAANALEELTSGQTSGKVVLLPALGASEDGTSDATWTGAPPEQAER